jgi:hypothetical protein
VISASVIVLVIRTRRPFFQSRPGKYLLIATLRIVAVTLVFPFSPLGLLFEFRPLPIPFFIVLGAIVVFYIVAAEMAVGFFFYNEGLDCGTALADSPNRYSFFTWASLPALNMVLSVSSVSAWGKIKPKLNKDTATRTQCQNLFLPVDSLL